MVNFTSICTSFTYQDKKKYAKIYRERVLRENAWNTREKRKCGHFLKKNEVILRYAKKNKSPHGLPRQYTDTALATSVKCLILQGFSRVREKVVVGFRPHLDHLK